MSNPLTSDQVIQLTRDATNGTGPSIPGENAAAFYDKVLPQVQEIKGRGDVVDIPFEHPHPDTPNGVG